jgi:predicted glycogen debranching enzyme
MLDFGRDICGNEQQATQREWLVTNGIGGYASGTISGILTRRYHGVLVAALLPPLGRTLLVAQLNEQAVYDGEVYPLFTNRWDDELVDPSGFVYLERFRLEGSTPIWSFACADALLEKRLWMQPGHNTTYIVYTLRRAQAPLSLQIKALVNYRDYHQTTYGGDWQILVSPVACGLRMDAFFEAAPFYLLSDRATATSQHDWHRNFWLAIEHYRGMDELDDHLCAGTFDATLQPGESLTLVASTEESPALDGTAAYMLRQEYDQQVLDRSQQPTAPPWVQQLILAADQFIVRRPSADDPDGKTILAGYHWFGDWGRDTMISLPGLTLATGRGDVAAHILRTFARFVDEGMLPNRFPDLGDEPEYNSVDASLWYIEAVRAYHVATGDETLLEELFPVLEAIMLAYQRGTRYGIRAAPDDGLLAAGEPGVQLTWMDARVNEQVITPRTGKPVEVNALWYSALCAMRDMARLLGRSSWLYETSAEQVRASFARFWNEATGYCYDVIDGPNGHDATLRPNQIFAVALPYCPLDEAQQRAVVDVCARHLLTSHGLRSLASDHPDYVGQYGGDPSQRDSSYHQGTVWGWLIGPFVRAHLRVYRDPVQAQSFLQPLVQHMADHGIGSVSEIFDGDPPHLPRGCVAQAWSVAELLHAWYAIQQVS